MRLILLTAMMLMALPALAQRGPGSFPASEKGPSATLISVTGANTANAIMEGVLTKADIAESCERNDPSLTKAGVARCVNDDFMLNKPVTASANCQTGAYISHGGTRLKRIGPEQWVLSNGNSIESVNYAPSVARIAEAQWKIMCPSFIQRTAGTTTTMTAGIPFAGTYNDKKSDCRRGESTEGYMKVTARGVDFYEAICKFRNVQQVTQKTYKIRAVCDAEGETMNLNLTFHMIGDMLQVEDGLGGMPQMYSRCR